MGSRAPFILIVDDDPDFLEMIRLVLETGGYRVGCFIDPHDALEKMAGEKPDLVITDVMMSRLDSGFTLARRIKQDPRFAQVRVILVTAASSQRGFDFTPQTPQELATMSADAYFSKPVEPKTLLAKVAELIGRPEGNVPS